METVTTEQKHAFDRLVRLQGSDEGMFVLAVHSFVEGWMRRNSKIVPDPSIETTFPDLTWSLREYLIATRNEYIPDLDVLNQLRVSHELTNHVRHLFDTLDSEHARAATSHLTRFCALIGLNAGQELTRLSQSLQAWNDRRPPNDIQSENLRLTSQLQESEKNSARLLQELNQLEILKAERDRLADELKRREQEGIRLRASHDSKKERIDELRAERASLSDELRTRQKEIVRLKDAEQYLHLLKEKLLLTRSRREYERRLIRLSPEQITVLSAIKLDADFLVKGSAGTGKTLVLLKAMDKAKGRGTGGISAQNGLELSELCGSVALLTYTRTLARYDFWLSGLMLSGKLDSGDRICTADTYLFELLTACGGTDVIWGKELETLATPFAACTDLGVKEFVQECEQFLWAWDVSQTEYLEQEIVKTGCKTTLPRNRRPAVWQAAFELETTMIASGRYSRCAAARAVMHALETDRIAPAHDYLFIDEAQDLPAVILKAFKRASRTAVILAGDSDQSIYQSGFSYKRAGIDIAGRTKILRSNFRNSVQIHALAEAYRVRNNERDSENMPEAWRTGPCPEYFSTEKIRDLAEALRTRIRLFTGVLGYECENICILAPTTRDTEDLTDLLKADGLHCADIRDDQFDFSASGSLRISTFHSAKGLDFPVVFLYLNKTLVWDQTLTEEAKDRMERNLIYVGMTRAMEHLDVFMLNQPPSPAAADLAALMKG